MATKFTRNRKEILKFINHEIKAYEQIREKESFGGEKIEFSRAIFSLENIKQFMTEKTDWI